MTWRYPADRPWRAEVEPRTARDGVALGAVAEYALPGLVLLRCPRCGGAILARGALDRAAVTVDAEIRCPCRRCQVAFAIAGGVLRVVDTGVSTDTEIG